jgi:hypothetical protein
LHIERGTGYDIPRTPPPCAGVEFMTDYERYETIHIAEKIVARFIDSKITDMECLNAVRKLKSVYDLINRERRIP